MVSIQLTHEEAAAYVAALERALDNPFIQDDDECQSLHTLLGHIEGSLYTISNWSIMRKIEREMTAAIANRSDWCKSNTMVRTTVAGDTHVYLHGNLITTIRNNGDMILSSCGWHSNTTKSRLNAILKTFLSGIGVWQKDFEWYIGRSQANCQPFFDGYTIVR
jgi:hypothetical protein